VPSARVLVYGMGSSGQAAARRLMADGLEVLALDDAEGTAPADAAAALGVELVARPDSASLAALARSASEIVVSPGVPAHHPVFALGADVPLVGEVELAWRHARTRMVAVTGTNGKTTVTTLVAAMLNASGVPALAAGNIGLPLLDAVDVAAEARRGPGGEPPVVVAEVSSFQLALTHTFRPSVAAWCNFSPDHLDWHGSLPAYRAAKARLWANAGPGMVAVANAEDAVVRAEAAVAAERGAAVTTFGLQRGDYRLDGASLRTPAGDEITTVGAMGRSLPHDLANALCASAAALAAGASRAGCAQALASFAGLPHRVELVREATGVRFYDDSKATTPGATLAALAGFESAVLIAGGRNKGLDLGVLRQAADRLRAVVAIGDAAAEVRAAFDGACPVLSAGSMHDAVDVAVGLARPGDAVVLSPACASFDWYRSYGERGDDFAREVRALGAPGAAPAGAGGAGR
jgi:UDP-N-acetylmuramoylalanine--D-glutamate ligase